MVSTICPVQWKLGFNREENTSPKWQMPLNVSLCPLKSVTTTNCSQVETPMRTTSMQMSFLGKDYLSKGEVLTNTNLWTIFERNRPFVYIEKVLDLFVQLMGNSKWGQKQKCSIYNFVQCMIADFFSFYFIYFFQLMLIMWDSECQCAFEQQTLSHRIEWILCKSNLQNFDRNDLEDQTEYLTAQ